MADAPQSALGCFPRCGVALHDPAIELIGPTSLQKAFASAVRQRERVNQDGALHTLRHSCATHLLEAPAPRIAGCRTRAVLKGSTLVAIRSRSLLLARALGLREPRDPFARMGDEGQASHTQSAPTVLTRPWRRA